MRQAINSLLPTGAHSLLAPYYSRRRARFQRDWAGRTNESDGRRPDQYVELDRRTVLLADCVERYAGKESRILDLCCNCGRNLAELWSRGYRDLHGVDLNASAVEYSKRCAPQMQRDAELVVSPVEEFLSRARDGGFDVTVSRGTSIEYVAPDYPLVREICRVTRRFCMLLLQPAADPYPRLWPYEFRRHGFALVEYRYYAHGNNDIHCFASPEALEDLERLP